MGKNGSNKMKKLVTSVKNPEIFRTGPIPNPDWVVVIDQVIWLKQRALGHYAWNFFG